MAQYIEFTDTDNGYKVRWGARDELGTGYPQAVIDIAKTETGFSGTKGVDWECVNAKGFES